MHPIMARPLASNNNNNNNNNNYNGGGGNNNDNNWLQNLLRDDVEVFIAFVNQTKRNIDLYWIENGRVLNFHMTLRPNEKVNVNTYRSHPWLFRECNTGLRMHVKNELMYWPVPTCVFHPDIPNNIVNIRQQVNVHYPLGKLVDICLWNMGESIMSEITAPNREDYVEDLPIPTTLKDELHSVLRCVSSYRENMTFARSSRRMRRRVE